MKKIIIALFLALTITTSAAVPEKVKTIIKNGAIKKWDTNFKMVKWEINKQQKAYLGIQGYRWDKKISQSIKAVIKSDAVKKWGTNYTMILWEMNKQQEAYLSL